MVIVMGAPNKSGSNARPRISQATIRGMATAKSFERGLEYAHDNSVSDLILRGDRLTADVEGSGVDPYRVFIRLSTDGVAGAYCTCPYDGVGSCKHIVAVLLRFADERTAVVESRPFAELLAGLDRSRLIELLEKRADIDPGFALWIEAELATELPTQRYRRSDAASPKAIDPTPVGRQARVLLSARLRHEWDDDRPTGDIEELQHLVDKAKPFLEAGDGDNALRIMLAICEAFVDECSGSSADTDEDAYELFADLGGLMAEAALMCELPPDERCVLIETLGDLQDQLDDDGSEAAWT
ncbi:SWIM zinc finger domain-containing protein, partial [Rhodopseudomonas sp. B29]|uniref:SWIM zinc finger family protein n=1 Tax=Rhodopseudomonas sp. B29 TaxID=95607 RepID=UPI0003B61F44